MGTGQRRRSADFDHSTYIKNRDRFTSTTMNVELQNGEDHSDEEFKDEDFKARSMDVKQDQIEKADKLAQAKFDIMSSCTPGRMD